MNISLSASVNHLTTVNPLDAKAGFGTAGKNEKAARDFEAMLLGPVFESLQKTFAGDSEDAKTPGASDYRQMATQALAQSIAARGGIGIARLILRHLEPPKVSGAG
jgi:Rod binding domain-containing protein